MPSRRRTFTDHVRSGARFVRAALGRRTLVVFDDAETVSFLVKIRTLIPLATSFDAASEARELLGKDVPCLERFAEPCETFDSLYERHAQAIFARLLPDDPSPRERLLAETVRFDVIRFEAPLAYQAAAIRRAMGDLRAESVLFRLRDRRLERYWMNGEALAP